MFFEEPSFEELIEKDEKILKEGKIQWGDKFDEINGEVHRCKEWSTRPDWFYDTEEKLRDPHYKRNGTREFWLQRLHDAEKELSELMISVANLDAERIESIANEIKTWDNTNVDCINRFPWRDVALCLLTYPQSVELDYDRCPVCRKKRVKLKFRSPAWTWSKLCGKEGEMVICLECRSQDFYCTICN